MKNVLSLLYMFFGAHKYIFLLAMYLGVAGHA